MNLEREFYEGVGRVVVAAAGLDFVLATMVTLMSPSRDDLWTVASAPGRAVRELAAIGKGGPPHNHMYNEVRTIAADARKALEGRHRVAHSLHIMTERSPGVRRAVTVHPKAEKSKKAQPDGDEPGSFGPLLTNDEMAELTQQIVNVAARASEWLIKYTGMSDPRRAQHPRRSS